MSDSLVRDVQDAVDALLAAEVKFVALDFDKTLLSVHTEEVGWGGKDFTNDIRPVFYHLIPRIIDNGIFLSIVTFSKQTTLISGLLETVFPNYYERIVLKTNDDTNVMRRNINFKGLRGKQGHMADAADEMNLKDAMISKATTLLIDDDRDNIFIALQQGVRALLFEPDEPLKILQDIKELPTLAA